MTCKDCINCDKCPTGLACSANPTCGMFKPKSRFVEVVRCKECKHSTVNEFHENKPLICCLTKMCGTVDPNWYCADGKWKQEKFEEAEKALKEREKE